jgi:hypothetical protein
MVSFEDVTPYTTYGAGRQIWPEGMSSVSVSSGRIFSGGEKDAFAIEDVEDEDFFVALAVRRGRPEVGRAPGDYCGRYRWRKRTCEFSFAPRGKQL